MNRHGQRCKNMVEKTMVDLNNFLPVPVERIIKRVKNIVINYIYINASDVRADINLDPVLNEIKEIHSANYVNGEIIKYWGYNDILKLLVTYDKELADLFLLINHNYPALLADLGRYIILYYYGGIYHDLRCLSKPSLLVYISSLPSNVTFIGEADPAKGHKVVRNGNIISLVLRHPLLLKVLQNIKTALQIAKQNNSKGSLNMFIIGSRSYINEFHMFQSSDVIKCPLARKGYIHFNSVIYTKKSRCWQSTNQYIFS